MESYKKALRIDSVKSREYYDSSLTRKTEQQKSLERLLENLPFRPARIADIACGGGGSSFHLSTLYPDAHFALVDVNEDAIAVAREATKGLRADCQIGDIFQLSFDGDAFDLVVCWQTLSWINDPEKALSELIRVCRPGGRIYASALFNLKHDVDIYSTVTDHTRPSSSQGLSYVYNTYSSASVRRWVAERVTNIEIHKFEMPFDLEYSGKGLGTYTIRLQDGGRLQCSAGMLLNWGILELQK